MTFLVLRGMAIAKSDEPNRGRGSNDRGAPGASGS